MSNKVVDNALDIRARLEGAASGDEAGLRSDRARTKVGELDLIRRRLAASADGHLERAADRILETGMDRRMPDAQYKDFVGSVHRAADYARLDDTLAELQRSYEKRERDPKVVREPRVYGAESPHSYFTDIAAIVSEAEHFVRSAAEARLDRYGQEVAYEIRRGSKEGRYAERAIGERARTDDPDLHEKRAREWRAAAREFTPGRLAEVRAITTGGGATASAGGGGAAAFVTPYFAMAVWAPFRGAHRTFADTCDRQPLPSFGLEIYVPAFTSTTAAAIQTEGSGVTETDPSAALQSAQIDTVSGQLTITQQFHDRGFTGNGSTDVQIAKQLQQQLDQAVNVYVLGQAIAAAGVVTDAVAPASGTFIPNFYADQAKAREILTDTAGTRLRPTHVFSTSDLYSYVTRQCDSTGRPIVVPTFAPGFPISTGADDGPQSSGPTPPWSRFTGTVLPGGTLWFTDDCIPASGSNTEVIVSAPQEAVSLYESDAPILTAFTEGGVASGLEVIVNLRTYVAAVARLASGTAVVSGAAYPSSLV
jgi:hypothetical protein